MSRIITAPVHKPYIIAREVKGVSHVHDTVGGKWQATLHTLKPGPSWPKPSQFTAPKSTSIWFIAVATHPRNPRARKGTLLGRGGIYELKDTDLDFLTERQDLLATSTSRDPEDCRLRFNSRHDAAAFFHANARHINKLFHPALGHARYDLIDV